MATRILKPDNQSSARNQAISVANQNFIENYKTGSFQKIGLDILGGGTTNTIYLKPWQTIDKETAYILNIKNRIHEVLCNDAFGSYWKVNTSASSASTSGIDKTSKVGYRVDGGTNLDQYLLIWAFANDANTQFEGFGLSQQPISVYLNITNGTRGSVATLTGLGFGNLSPAHAYTIGSTVLVRNTYGSYPYAWNYGIVTAINSTSSIDVLMHPTLDMGNTDIPADLDGFILQLDKFFPWNGRNDTSNIDDRIWKPNYKLVGIISILDPGTFMSVRKADDHWFKESYLLTALEVVSHVHTIARTTTYTIPYARVIPYWSRTAYLSLAYNRNGWDIEYSLSAYYGAGTQIEWQIFDNYSSGTRYQMIPIAFNQGMRYSSSLTTSGAGTTALLNVTLRAYNDGGLQEL